MERARVLRCHCAPTRSGLSISSQYLPCSRQWRTQNVSPVVSIVSLYVRLVSIVSRLALRLTLDLPINLDSETDGANDI
ncbi:hypothetical protein FGIG_04217 [Fasciola gigantica]|uniref:Uncharacterized protein n=1 Tax=Fasciola gigantica TaxID=46835 RepID=A0A504YAU6_FASGI|nr:hypothetical protein FGIG_04217 [Fasciola gigantica]